MKRNDRGQAVPLLLVVLTLVAVSAGVIVKVGVSIGRERSAQITADATALAGVIGGRDAAEYTATQNRGTIVGYVLEGNDVQVAVIGNGHRAFARASKGSPPFKTNHP